MRKKVFLVSVFMMAFASLQAEESKYVNGGPLEFPQQFTAAYDTLNLNGLLPEADSYFYPDSIAKGEGNYFTSYSINPFEFVFLQQVTDWGGFLMDSWGGFIYSNMTDNTTPGFMNQYSAITGGGTDGAGSAYLIGYDDIYSLTGLSVAFTGNQERILYGGYVTNSTWAYWVIKDGDDFANPFEDGDWFKIEATGYSASGNPTTTESFYLADFRDGKSEIVNNWQWFDLSSLGKVNSVKFSISSSDVGEWGINTPTYFCLDKLFAEKETSSVGLIQKQGVQIIPLGEIYTILSEQPETICVFDVYGKLLQRISSGDCETIVDLSNYPANVYIIKVGNEVVKVVKR